MPDKPVCPECGGPMEDYGDGKRRCRLCNCVVARRKYNGAIDSFPSDRVPGVDNPEREEWGDV